MSDRPGIVLVLEDGAQVRDLVAHVLRSRGYGCELAANAGDARRILAASPIDVCLCDLTLEGNSALAFAAEVTAKHTEVALVMMSGSDDVDVAERTLELGAYDYLMKPFRNAELVITVANALHRGRLEREAAALRRSLEDTVAARTLELALSREETIHRLARAVEFRDAGTGSHVERMSAFCRMIALRLGLPTARAALIRTASLLHDIGKVSVPDGILIKPGPLTPEERAQMQEHTSVGHRILSNSTSELIETAGAIALTHHERYDGRGYPRGMRGEEIPLEGRIAAVCDVFDALTTSRPYRADPFSRDAALDVLRADRGMAFDPVIADAFLSATDEVDRIRARYADLDGTGADARTAA